MVSLSDYVISVDRVGTEDAHHVGTKAANIGKLKSKNISSPQGFVVTTASYFKFLEKNKLDQKIKHLLGATNHDHHASIEQISQYIKKYINSSHIPQDLVSEIDKHYEQMGKPKVSMYISLVSGDRGDVENVLIFDDIEGEASLIHALRSAWSHLFDPHLILDRYKKGIDHLKTGISVFVQEKITPEVYGKIFTVDHHANDKSKVGIEIDNGTSSEFFVIDKLSYDVEKRNYILKPLVYVKDGKKTPSASQLIDKHHLIALAKLALELEKEHMIPQVLHWAKRGDKFYILEFSNILGYGKN